MSYGQRSDVDSLTDDLANTTLASSSVPTRSDGSSGNGGARERTPPSVAGESRSGSDGQRSVTTSQAPTRKKDLPHHEVQLAHRPGLCKIGTDLTVIANYFRVSLPDCIRCYEYNVRYEVRTRDGKFEELTKREKCRPIFWQLVSDDRQGFFPPVQCMVYNDVNLLWTTRPLKMDRGQVTFDLGSKSDERGGGGDRGGDRGGRGGGRPAPRGPSIKVHFLANPIKEYKDYLTDQVDKGGIVQLLDLIITQKVRCTLSPISHQFVTHGKNIFRIARDDRAPHIGVGDGLEIWKGFHGAVKIDSPQSILYNVNVADSAFYKIHMNLVEFLCEVAVGFNQGRNVDPDNIAIDPRVLNNLSTILRGQKLTVETPNGPTTKPMKFVRFGNIPGSNQMFTDSDGNRISVIQHYMNKYRYRVRYPHFQLVQLGDPRKNLFFPMELVFTGADARKYKGKLSDIQLARMIKAACRDPNEQRLMIAYLSRIDGDLMNGEDEFMREFGVHVDREMIDVPAKMLLAPKMHFANEPQPVPTGEDGSWDYLNAAGQARPVCDAPPPIVPFLIFVNEPVANVKGEAQRHIKVLLDVMADHGIKVAANPEIATWNIGPETARYGNLNERQLSEMLDHVENVIAKNGKGQPYTPVVFFVFRKRLPYVYSTIKSFCDVRRGIVSQCILEKTFKSLNGRPLNCSSAQLLRLKLTCKAGGLSWKIDRSFHKNWQKVTDQDHPTLFLGVDVTHPGAEERAARGYANQKTKGLRPGEKAAPAKYDGASYADQARSVYSVVGNVDIDAMRYGVSSRVQRGGLETGIHITKEVYDRIVDFHAHTGLRPERIIVYRDGVSETEFKKVFHQEKSNIMDACAHLDPNYKPKLAYIVAQKRHNTRFFSMEDKHLIKQFPEWQRNNFRPGLLVEQGVTSRDRFDFFIQSHASPLGTARPTHYTVLYDEINESQSFWQTLLYAHSYGYLRTNRAISLPAPLAYAHLAAKRAKVTYDCFSSEPPEEYIRSREDIVRDQMEKNAVTPHERLRNRKCMLYM